MLIPNYVFCNVKVLFLKGNGYRVQVDTDYENGSFLIHKEVFKNAERAEALAEKVRNALAIDTKYWEPAEFVYEGLYC